MQCKERKIMLHPKWYDKTAIKMKNWVNKLHKRFKNNQSVQLYEFYRMERKKYTQYIRKQHYNYKVEMQQLIDDDPQQFYRHVRLSTNQTEALPSKMSYDHQVSNTHTEATEFFKSFFQSVYCDPIANAVDHFDSQPQITDKIKDICAQIPCISITQQRIHEQINALPNNLVAGPDEIPNMFLKRCAESIISPITFMLRESLDTGKTPAIWKKSFVIPIHKSGKKNVVENYRGVAIQCSIPKLLDSIVSKHLNHFLENIIPFDQHGFIAGRSTITNLTDFVTRVMRGMQTSKQVDAIYLDIKKAFDSVDIRLLCHKLQIMGLNEQLLNWLRDYLTNRQQLVKVNTNNISSQINVTSGVGQGYPIGATLFILFIADLPSFIKNALIHLYADDAKISLEIKNNNDCVLLQEDLNRVANYFNAHCLKLNINKSKSISFYRHKSPINFNYSIYGDIIEKVTVIKDLGVILDRSLSFKNHIELISTRAKSRLAWIKRFSKEFNDPWVIKKLYMTFVLPIIEYASQIWSPIFNYQIGCIESVQKQFLLYALRKFKWRDRLRLPSYKHRLLLLDMNTLNDRRSIARISFIHSVFNSKISSPTILSDIKIKVPNRQTRANRNFSLFVNSLNDPLNLMCKLYNEFSYMLDLDQSVDNVKNNLKKHFKNII